MAYNRTYYFNFSSLAGWDYHIEFFDQVNSNNTYMDIEGKLGPGGCEISYDTDGADIFAPMKPSTLTIEFLVRDSIDQGYIDALRNDRAERDVYVHIYRQTVQGVQSPTATPLWTGYLLMDLTNDKDEDYPTIVNLKAVDGIASMKYYDFVPTATAQSSENYYSANDTWKATGTNGYDTERTFVDWIHLALKYGGFSTPTEGRVGYAKINICANWLNAEMPSSTINPLANTEITPSQFYTQKEVEGDVFWEAMSAYDVIKHICITWGMRFLMWRGEYYFVQISNYSASNGGTGASPLNITRYRYYLDSGTYVDTKDNIGTMWTKYQINLCTGYTLADSGMQRLKGGAYGILPKLKQVTVDFLNVSDINYFTQFPLLANPWYTGNAGTYGKREEEIIATIYEPSELFYQEIWLNFVNNSGYDVEIVMNWTIVARQAGSSTWAKQLYLDWNINPGALTPTWVNYYGLQLQYTYQYGPVMGGHLTLPQGQSTQNICSAAHAYVPLHLTGLTGQIEFGYETMAYWGDAPAGDPQNLYIESHGRLSGAPGGVTLTNSDPISNNVGYTNTTINQGQGSSILAPIVNGSIGTNSTQSSVVQSGDDSMVRNVEGILWGDTLSILAGGGLQVNDGTGLVPTNYSGQWGIATLSGNKSLSMLLAEEHLKRQFGSVKTYDVKFAQGVTGKYYNDGSGQKPNFAGPLSRYKVPDTGIGVPASVYIMHTGKWSMADDEWSMRLYEYKTFSLSGTTNTSLGIGGYLSGATGSSADPAPIDNSSAGQRISNPNGIGNRLLDAQRRNSFQPLTRISANIAIDPETTSGTSVTSLDIVPIGEDILKTGDKISIKTATNSRSSLTPGDTELERNTNRYTFTLSSDQSAADDTLSVDALTIYSQITTGDAVTIDEADLIEQYQTKTRGTIGGMRVTADSFDEAKSVGRQQVCFRGEGDSLSEETYYTLNGEDNNKSGRFGSTNSSAPDDIGTQRAVKSGNFICDADYKIDSGTSVITGDAGWDIKIQLYKTTPVDGASAATPMTLIGEFDVELDGDTKTQTDQLGSLSTATIAKGDIIIPHIYAPLRGTGTSFDFRGGITYTLIRQS